MIKGNNLIFPQIEEYQIIVNVPLAAPLVIARNQSLYDVEKFFADRAKTEEDELWRKQFNQARNIMMFARHSEAKLVSMRKTRESLILRLKFFSLTNLMGFKCSTEIASKGLMML